jgi:hypothetical protein
MKKELLNLFIFLGICFVGYLIFSNLSLKEGMTTTDGSGNKLSSSLNGVAGNAATYAANIKSQTVKLSDTLLVSKYRSDYETTILNMDDLINALMLETTLKIDASKPSEGLEKIVKLNQAKAALDNVMKFVDKN